METILIINPDPLERNSLMRLLSTTGIQVLEAADCLEGVRIANQCEVLDLVVIPCRIALDVCREIVEKHPGVTFIFTSTSSENTLDTGHSSLAPGCDSEIRLFTGRDILLHLV